VARRDAQGGGSQYDRDRVARLFDEPGDAEGCRRRTLVSVEGSIPHEAARTAFERLELCSDDVLLDVGTGEGRLAVAAARVCRQVIGIDISKKSLERARARAREGGFDNVVFAYGAFEDLSAELRLQSFPINKILAVYSLHHLPDPLKRSSLEELAGLLCHPGRIVIGDLMFFRDPEAHRGEFDDVGFDGGETDFPAYAEYLIRCLRELGAEVSATQVHPLVGVLVGNL
jgi:SAM-dependent methyltransferase